MDDQKITENPAPGQGESPAQAHIRALIGRVEDSYFAYETAERKSDDEAAAHKEWQAARAEINDTFNELLTALEAYTEWQRLRSWAMGADDAESWRKAHAAESNFHAKASSALSKVGAASRVEG